MSERTDGSGPVTARPVSEAIVAALEAGDHALAADRVRANYTSDLPNLEAQLRNPDLP